MGGRPHLRGRPTDLLGISTQSVDLSGHLGLSHGQREGTPGSIHSLARQRQPLDWVSHSPTVRETKGPHPVPNLPFWVVPSPQVLTPLVLRGSHSLPALPQRLRQHFPNNGKEGRKRKEEKQPETSLQVTTLQTAEVSDPGSTLPIHTHVETCAWT